MLKDLTENAIATIVAVVLILLTIAYYGSTLIQLITATFDNLPH